MHLPEWIVRVIHVEDFANPQHICFSICDGPLDASELASIHACHLARTSGADVTHVATYCSIGTVKTRGLGGQPSNFWKTFRKRSLTHSSKAGILVPLPKRIVCVVYNGENVEYVCFEEANQATNYADDLAKFGGPEVTDIRKFSLMLVQKS